jgi:hypothetical protein
MSIQTAIDLEKQLTIHTVEGDVNFDEAMEVFKKYYSGKTTRNVLWDFSTGSMVNFSSDQIRVIANFLSGVSDTRSAGKTAGVVHQDVDFGLARVFETLVESSSYKPSIRIFRKYDEAMNWLQKEK